MLTDQGPPHLVIVGNSFTEVKGQEHIKTYKVRQDAQSIMFLAECCKACVAIKHPVHHPPQFICPADVCNINSPKYEITRYNQLCRFYTRSWDRANDANAYDLPPFHGPVIRDPNWSCNRAIWTWVRRRFCLRHAKEAGDVDLDDIAKKVGEPTILGLD